MNQTQTRSLRKRVLSLILAVVMAVSLLPISAFASGDSTSTTATTSDGSDGYEYNIMFLDCGRKYYSVDSIKKIIDNASAAGFNYIQLAVGNDGLRFLLDDMSLTVNGTTYGSDAVKEAIQTGNTTYNASKSYKSDKNELSESEMDAIIAYAASKGMGVIPCVNTPGHMDAILSAASSLTGTNCSYSSSARTIDVTNTTAVAFTQALLQKYITYFAGKNCKLFNMGADEYANDKFTGGSMGFGNLQSTGKYKYYVEYVNQLAQMIKAADMKPMAFNDGIYFNNNTSSGTFDTDIIICYWSSGWGTYNPMPASTLDKMGFRLVNTDGSYYWVLGKTDTQCSANKASGFKKNSFPGNSTIDNPVGSMFCIWADYPGAETGESVISKTAATIAAFGKTLPEVKKVETVESKTVTKDNVTVTAPGLTDLTVAAADAPAIDAAAEGKVVAYNVTPATASGNYKKNGTVTLPIPEGWDASHVRGFVQNEDGSITTVTGTPADGKFTFTVPHFSVLGVYELAANAVDKTENVTVVQGSESEAYLLSGNVTLADGTYTTDDGVASYTIKTTTVTTPSSATAADSIVSGNEYIIGNGEQWLALSSSLGITSVANKDQATKWTIEGNKTAGYTIKNKNGSSYLGYTSSGHNRSLTVSSKSTSWQWDGNGFNVKLYNYYSYYISYSSYGYNSGWTLSYNSGDANPYVLTPEKTTTTKTVVFTGLKAGETTSVIIGDTQYNVTVTAEDLSKVTPLKLEYWITNASIDSVTGADSESRNKVLESGTYQVYFTNIAAKADGVASEAGVDVTTIAPANTSHKNRTVYYWRCRMLDTTLDNNSTSKTQEQTGDGGDDETMSGVGFTKIRYYGSSWQVFTENNEWVTVDADKNQLIAYYLEYIKVSDEVESFAADWGNRGDGSKGGWLDTSNYCTLSMQVVYEDGTTNPTNTTASALKSKTIVYGYWNDKNGRGVGTILLDGQEYEIYKVTSKTGEAIVSFSGNDTATAQKFTWDDNEMTVWEGDPSSNVSIHNDATGFSTEGANANLCWDKNKEAILLRVYVRAKVTEDSLTVNYYDESNTTLPFYSYNIAVASGTTFNNDFAYRNGSLINNTVTNIKNVTQTVNWKLEEMSEIGAQYRYGNYTFTNATKETGNKVVNLYYKFKTEKTFVVDFGLPLHIEKTDINPALASANITEVAVGKSLYATINANADYSIDYILNKTIDGSDRVTVTYSGTNKDTGKDDSATYNLTVIPATSVYYEDSFATFNPGAGAAADAKWLIDKDDTAAKVETNQALSALGAQDIYGYDKAYKDSTKLSMGSAHKVTVSADMAKTWTPTSQWPTATFTFKGTGFDVISLTNSDSGTVVYTVTNKSTGASESHIINNYYGYRYDEATGKWVVENNDNTAPYQVPVIKVSGLPYDTYEVTISVIYGELFDNTNDNQYSFWLDAIRVYDPAGATLDTEYAKDHENAPNYVRIKQVILDSEALKTPGATGAVFIDGKGENGVTADDYKNQGPNHEAYLANRQAIAFQLIAKDKPTSVQIGAKLASGNSASLKIGGAACAKANGGTLTLKTATDMYYELTDMGWQKDGEVYKSNVITLTNDGSGIISLTNLKFIGAKYTGSLPEVKSATSETNLVTLAVSSEMIDEALTTVDGALNPAPETFEPSHFEADWNRSVRAGQKATLTVKTSEDVDAITVDGQTITTYRTRTERTGWGWWSPRVTYRVFTYTTTAQATADYEVCALNSSGVASEPITATLTVKPAINWWHKWF